MLQIYTPIKFIDESNYLKETCKVLQIERQYTDNDQIDFYLSLCKSENILRIDVNTDMIYAVFGNNVLSSVQCFEQVNTLISQFLAFGNLAF